MNCKTEKKRFIKGLIVTGILVASISFIYTMAENSYLEYKKVISDFNDGVAIVCKDTIVSKEKGWRFGSNSHIVTNGENVFKFSSCRGGDL